MKNLQRNQTLGVRKVEVRKVGVNNQLTKTTKYIRNETKNQVQYTAQNQSRQNNQQGYSGTRLLENQVEIKSFLSPDTRTTQNKNDMKFLSPQPNFQSKQKIPFDPKYLPLETKQDLYETKKEQPQPQEPSPTTQPNYGFFSGQVKSSGGLSIDEMLLKCQDKDWMEYDHRYIQWLIPNYFASKFNSDSHPLTEEEVFLIKKDRDVYDKYREGVRLFLDFLGIEYDWRKKFIRIANKKFLDTAIYVKTHNRLRIQRLLASLLAFAEVDLVNMICEELRTYFVEKTKIRTFQEDLYKTIFKDYIYPQVKLTMVKPADIKSQQQSQWSKQNQLSYEDYKGQMEQKIRRG